MGKGKGKIALFFREERIFRMDGWKEKAEPVREFSISMRKISWRGVQKYVTFDRSFPPVSSFAVAFFFAERAGGRSIWRAVDFAGSQAREVVLSSDGGSV
ncbi:MAG: hypothetical protein V4710_17030 [Verrucomicrobiota bacterium]